MFQRLYHVVSAVEPGTISQDPNHKAYYPALVVFMLVGRVTDPLQTFEKMLSDCRKLAVGLNAELCDSHRCHLTSQTIAHYQEIIRESHRIQMLNK